MRQWFLVLSLVFLGLNSVQAQEMSAAEQRSLDLLPTGEINREILGINAFGNQLGFGTPKEQFREIKETLGIRYVRLLFAWTDGVHPSPNSPINFGFSDNLLKSLPRKMRAVVVVAGAPSWMQDPGNWVKGDPRRSFHKYFFKPVVSRYRRKKKIEAIQVWNEPDLDALVENSVMDVTTRPENYIEMLKRGAKFMRRRAKKQQVVAAATTSIFQNFPETLEYNEDLQDLGIEKWSDVWAMHLYGTSFERMFLGIGSFLNSVSKPIWVTESGRQGVFEQLEYAQKFWPFLEEQVPGVERIYHYRFTENQSAESAFGLKNSSGTNTTSDLYEHLAN